MTRVAGNGGRPQPQGWTGLAGLCNSCAAPCRGHGTRAPPRSMSLLRVPWGAAGRKAKAASSCQPAAAHGASSGAARPSVWNKGGDGERCCQARVAEAGIRMVAALVVFVALQCGVLADEVGHACPCQRIEWPRMSCVSVAGRSARVRRGGAGCGGQQHRLPGKAQVAEITRTRACGVPVRVPGCWTRVGSGATWPWARASLHAGLGCWLVG